MRDLVSIKQGNTHPPLRRKLDIDVEGMRAVFTMSHNGRVIVDRADCTIENGHAVYFWRQGDTDAVGTMQAEVTLIHPDGSTQTDPQDGYIQITVQRALAVVSAATPPALPVNIALPTLAGPTDGGALVASVGAWDGQQTLALTVQQQEGTAGPVQPAGDVAEAGYRYRTQVVATNAAGQTEAHSAWSAIVAPALVAPFVVSPPALTVKGDDLLVTAPVYGGTDPLNVTLTVLRGAEDVTHLIADGRIAKARGTQQLSYTAKGTATNAAGAVTTQTDLTLAGSGVQPIAGIMDAPNVIVLGASHAASGFGADGSQRMHPMAQSMGYQGQLWSYAVPATTLPDALTQYANSLKNAAIAATQGRNCYIVDQGGNDIAHHRGGGKTLAQIRADMRTLIATITGDGNKVVYVNQSKRIAPWAGLQAGDDLDAVGMKIYNETVFDPIVAELLPAQVDAQGRNRVTTYPLADQYPAYLSADGNHGYGGYESVQVYGEAVLASVMAAAKGQTLALSRSGKGFLWTFGNRLEKRLAPINRMRIESASAFPHTLSGAQASDGGTDGGIRIVAVQPNTASVNAGQGSGAAAFARIADARFHDATVLSDYGIYVQNTTVAKLHIDGLTPGDTARVTAVASRAVGSSDRRGTVTVGAQSLELDAGTAAASNQIVFAPMVVPANGRIEVSLAVAPGSTYGYLSALAVDFV